MSTLYYKDAFKKPAKIWVQAKKKFQKRINAQYPLRAHRAIFFLKTINSQRAFIRYSRVYHLWQYWLWRFKFGHTRVMLPLIKIFFFGFKCSNTFLFL